MPHYQSGNSRTVLAETRVVWCAVPRDLLCWKRRGWRHAPLFLQLLRIPWHGRLPISQSPPKQNVSVSRLARANSHTNKNRATLRSDIYGEGREKFPSEKTRASNAFVLHNLVPLPIIIAHTISEGRLT